MSDQHWTGRQMSEKNIFKLKKKSCCKLLEPRILDSGPLRCSRKKSIWLSLIMFHVGPVAYLRLSNFLRGQLLSQRLVVSVQVACFQVYVSGECELLLRPKMRVYTLRKQLSRCIPTSQWLAMKIHDISVLSTELIIRTRPNDIGLETSALKLFMVTIYVINSVADTKLPCYTLPPTQHHSFFRNLPPSFVKIKVKQSSCKDKPRT